MEHQERHSHVIKWTKWHGISIPKIDGQNHLRRYVLDFLKEYDDGRKAAIEVKNPPCVDSNDVQCKRKATEMWCKLRQIDYIIMTKG